ncbi:MAG: hypothetical protein COB37_03395 [Kordiimonadales bacterium]|nr:MAG: hypothetical protein COB37_03395 [Kordiimonadales bacterium]
MRSNKLIAAASMIVFATVGVTAADDAEKMDHFKKADANGDGTVTHAEMTAAIGKRFAGLDKNGDGFIELSELPEDMSSVLPMRHIKKDMRENKRKMRENHSQDDEALRGKKRKMMHRRKPTRISFIARLDKDGDEKVSLVEFAKKPTHMFKRADANGDGTVTSEEAVAAKSHRGRGARGGHRRMRKQR